MYTVKFKESLHSPLLRGEYNKGTLTLCDPDFLQLTEVLEEFCSRQTKNPV